jgi:hypothetical protein
MVQRGWLLAVLGFALVGCSEGFRAKDLVAGDQGFTAETHSSSIGADRGLMDANDRPVIMALSSGSPSEAHAVEFQNIRNLDLTSWNLIPFNREFGASEMQVATAVCKRYIGPQYEAAGWKTGTAENVETYTFYCPSLANGCKYSPFVKRSHPYMGRNLVFSKVPVMTQISCGTPAIFSSAVFDWQEYLELNRDVVAALDYSEEAAKNHWRQYGVHEGRAGRHTFSPQEYLNIYADLRAAFGRNMRAAVLHFAQHGVNEGRVGRELLHPDLFNVAEYLALHTDLRAAFGSSTEAAREHWLAHGVKEGRSSSYRFNVRNYLARYPHLTKAFGSDFRAAALHWVNDGRREGRIGR